MLRNQIAEYAVAVGDREEFDGEIERWINDGWLEEYDERVHGVVTGVIPLMAAQQPNKPTKVRPVMDYRKLNEWIVSKGGGCSSVPGETEVAKARCEYLPVGFEEGVLAN